jgi:hypothetical protein
MKDKTIKQFNKLEGVQLVGEHLCPDWLSFRHLSGMLSSNKCHKILTPSNFKFVRTPFTSQLLPDSSVGLQHTRSRSLRQAFSVSVSAALATLGTVNSALEELARSHSRTGSTDKQWQ